MSIYDLTVLEAFPRANVIEWYVLPKPTVSEDPLWIPLSYETPMFPSIPFRNPVFLEEYRYKELIYSYDRSNDGQRTLFRQAWKEDWNPERNLYRVLFQEDILPSHRFPCSVDMEKSDVIQRRSFKINNRLSLIEETLGADEKKPGYIYYLRYNHAYNVDIPKIQKDLDDFIRRYKF
jgi:hypothetical protein